MEVASKIFFGLAAGGVLWMLHRWIGAYPPPLPRSPTPRREAATAGLLWLVALSVGLAVVLQGMAGSLFGIVCIKTRSLWPGVACHYLINWFSAILAAAFRS